MSLSGLEALETAFICAKNRQNPPIPFKVTIDNVGVPFLRHNVSASRIQAILVTLFYIIQGVLAIL